MGGGSGGLNGNGAAVIVSGSGSTEQSVTITPAPLTITANNADRVVDGPEPTLTASYSGFVGSEGPSNLAGSLSIADATANGAAVGTYPGALVPSGLTSTNYAISYAPGTMTIHAGSPTTTTLVANPSSSLVGQPVIFTADVTSGGNPASGSVQFVVNGLNTGVPVALADDGTATDSWSSKVVGSDTIQARFFDDTAYSPSTATTSIDVQAAPATTMTTLVGSDSQPTYGESVTYTAQVTPISSGMGTPSGSLQFLVDGLDDGGPVTPAADGSASFTPSKVLQAGNHLITAEFMIASGIDSLVTLSPVISKATPSIGWSAPAAITFGTPLGTTQLDATPSVAGNLGYSPAAGTILGGGYHTLSATFTPTDPVDYTSVAATVTLDVLRATPTINWVSPPAINHGTPLSSAQLKAAALVAGTFAYTPAAGAILGVGQQSLSTTFTPTDTTDYAPVTTTVSILVLPAVPTITWATPAAIPDGTPLGSAQLDATAAVPGMFTYTPAAGTVLLAGKGQTLSETFTPTDTTDYGTVTTTQTIDVLAKTSLILSVPSGLATLGQSVTLSAAVSATAGNGTPTGSVTFLDGTTVLGSSTLDRTGHATLSTARLPLGTLSITASYSGDSADAASTSPASSLYVGDPPKVDFDGDRKVDLAVFGKDPSTGRYDYRIIDSSTGKTVVYDNNGYGYGNAQSIPIVGDFFGDGRSSYALWTPNALGGMTFTAVSPLTYKSLSINFGATTDLPVVADLDGDGKDDFGVYGFQTGLNYRFDFVLSSDNFSVNAQDLFNNNGYGYGNAQSIPIVADFDGSGKAGFGLYNPSANGSNFAYVSPSANVSFSRTVGTANDTPTAVDYDGDGKADLVLYGPDPTKHGTYRYLVLDSTSGYSTTAEVTFNNFGNGYGNATSIPVMADYEGTGKADFGLFTADGKGGNEFVYQLGQTGAGVTIDFATATDISLTAPTYLIARKVRGVLRPRGAWSVGRGR